MIIDKKICTALGALGSKDAAYWEFRRQARRDGLHGLFQYPAMMVPKMQGDVLDAILLAAPSLSKVWDPFLGAGTALVESMTRGLDFTGYDINPLAVLLCEAKSGCLDAQSLQDKVHELLERYEVDSNENIEVEFPGQAKWFNYCSSVELSQLRRGIQSEPDRWARRIMWVCLAETVRRVSNSRTSTYKLHIRPVHELWKSQSPKAVFKEEILKSVERVKFHEKILSDKSLLNDGRYAGNLHVECRDIRTISAQERGGYDLMLTSPPYGDNRSTVPYGQFSYLPLQWIPTDELSGDKLIFKTAYSTDTRSLGGSNASADEKANIMRALSREFDSYYSELGKVDRPGLKNKVASFIYDFFEALRIIVNNTNPGGVLVWTLGDRTVGGIPVPFVNIARELQAEFGLKHVTTVRRAIPSKRTPSRNSVSSTMGTECLLVMRRDLYA